MVGDRGYDTLGAGANGVPTILVEWGYGSPPRPATPWRSCTRPTSCATCCSADRRAPHGDARSPDPPPRPVRRRLSTRPVVFGTTSTVNVTVSPVSPFSSVVGLTDRLLRDPVELARSRVVAAGLELDDVGVGDVPSTP